MRSMENNYYLDWIVMALNLYSYYLIGCKKEFGFILAFIGALSGVLMFSVLVFSIPMIFMYSSFATLNIINYVKWKGLCQK